MFQVCEVFIQTICLCPCLQRLLFSVISILFQGTVFGFEVILTFTAEITVQQVMLFIHAAQLGPAFNMPFMSKSLHPHASSIKPDALYSEFEVTAKPSDLLSYRSKKIYCILKLQFILFQCFKWFCHIISWAGSWRTDLVNILNATTQSEPVQLCCPITAFRDISR